MITGNVLPKGAYPDAKCINANEMPDFLKEIGIDNYIMTEKDLTIPIGWKGKYKKPNRELSYNEQLIIDYIEMWG